MSTHGAQVVALSVHDAVGHFRIPKALTATFPRLSKGGHRRDKTQPARACEYVEAVRMRGPTLLARKSVSPAISSGVPKRPTGVAFSAAFRASSVNAASTISVVAKRHQQSKSSILHMAFEHKLTYLMERFPDRLRYSVSSSPSNNAQ